MDGFTEAETIGFRTVLQAAGIAQGGWGHYFGWVATFRAFCLTRQGLTMDSTGLAVFLGEMERSGRDAGLVAQARVAVLLFGRKVGFAARGHPTEAAGKVLSPEWRGVVDRVVAEVRMRHYSPKTLKAYRHWVETFGRWAMPRMPAAMEADAAREFLTHLVERGVSASTQNQAFSALQFLFLNVWKRDFSRLASTPRPSRRVHLPEALDRPSIDAVLRALEPPWRLVVQLLYGCGLRLGEALNLRIQDIDLRGGVVRAINGKGSKSRAVPLPRVVRPELEAHLEAVKTGFAADIAKGFHGAFLPDALERKFPSAARDWPWQWVFPAPRLTIAADGRTRRAHLHETGLQKAVSRAARKAGLGRRVHPHMFRHSYATELLRLGYDIRTVQDLLGHSEVGTTMIYTHVLQASSGQVISPLDA